MFEIMAKVVAILMIVGGAATMLYSTTMNRTEFGITHNVGLRTLLIGMAITCSGAAILSFIG